MKWLIFVLSFGLSTQVGFTAPVPTTFFGVSVTGSGPLKGGIAIGGSGKVGGLVAGWLEATCDGGTDPKNACYTWSGLTSFVNKAQANEAVIIYDFSIPGWMCGKPGAGTGCNTLPSDLSNLSNFATALATKYKGQIHYYETGNEVNNPPNWTDTCANLVLVHNTIYAAIKSVDPAAIVGAPNMAVYNGTFGGGGACVNSPAAAGNVASIWLTNFLNTKDRNGNYPTVDTVGVHTYASQIYTSLDGCNWTTYKLGCAAGPLLHIYNSFRAVMTSNGLTSVPLLVSEGGFGIDDNSAPGNYGCSTNPNALTACLSPAQQVAYIGRWLVLGASTWADGNGQLANWYGYDLNWGTLNGNYSMNPQNASAYGQMQSWLRGAIFSQQCQSGSSSTIYICDFTNVGQQYEIVFNNSNGATSTYSVPTWAKRFRPLLGTAQPISGGTILVGDMPILLSAAIQPPTKLSSVVK